MDQIDRFPDDIRNAEASIAGCEQAVEELRPELDQRLRWDVDHNFPRLRRVDAELAGPQPVTPIRASPGKHRCSGEHRE